MDEKTFTMFKMPNRQNSRIWMRKEDSNDPKNYFFRKDGKSISCFAAVNWMGKSNIRIYAAGHRNKKKSGLFICLPLI